MVRILFNTSVGGVDCNREVTLTNWLTRSVCKLCIQNSNPGKAFKMKIWMKIINDWAAHNISETILFKISRTFDTKNVSESTIFDTKSRILFTIPFNVDRVKSIVDGMFAIAVTDDRPGKAGRPGRAGNPGNEGRLFNNDADANSGCNKVSNTCKSNVSACTKTVIKLSSAAIVFNKAVKALTNADRSPVLISEVKLESPGNADSTLGTVTVGNVGSVKPGKVTGGRVTVGSVIGGTVIGSPVGELGQGSTQGTYPHAAPFHVLPELGPSFAPTTCIYTLPESARFCLLRIILD